MLLNIQNLFVKYRIEPTGVIHIGAHTGQELAAYKRMKMRKILFIEANPEVYEKLKVNVAEENNVLTSCCAISNYNGETILRVTSNDQSSSVLSLKYHKKLYPNIVETKQIKVKCRTVDTLLQELKLSPESFNFINIDIQGAELLAFQGAMNSLRHIKAINSEVNLKELYESCVLLEDLDKFLQEQGFERKEINTPFDPSWGDAFYVRIK